MDTNYKIFIVCLVVVFFCFYTLYRTTSESGTHLQHLEEIPTSSNDFDSVLYNVKHITKCLDKPAIPRIKQKGDYWVLYDYVIAERTFRCHESITYTTHADYTFLDNILPLVERWLGPVSVAVHAPGTDFKNTLDSIAYLRDCTNKLVKEYVTFHIYFSAEHIPKEIPHHDHVFAKPYDCSLPPPFFNSTSNQTYKTQNDLLYPINVGRNVARESAQTHYVLASDVELHPSLHMIPQFLEMIANNSDVLLSENPKVFPLNLFEVAADQQVPGNKTQLQEMLANKTAIPFHKNVCPLCHMTPAGNEWQHDKASDSLNVFTVGKRTGKFEHWEPIYIGTNHDPLYDERLSWEGKRDKMTQGYALCVLNYDFLILDNAFLVHRPGIKVYKNDDKRNRIAGKQSSLIDKIIFPELKVLYGIRDGCTI